MNDILVGDRVTVSDLIGTVKYKVIKHIENEHHYELNGFNGTNGLSNPENSREIHTFIVEWDDMTKGDFERESNRLKKSKELKFNILRYFRYIMGDKFYDSKVYEILKNRFFIMDSYRPCSVVSYEEISEGSTFELEFRSKYLCTSDSIETIEMDGSDRKYEFVGMDKALDFFSNANNLYAVSLNNSKISKIGNIEKFTKCSELYLSNNLLNSSEINSLFQYFPKLNVLDVSGNLIDKPLNASKLKVLIMNRSFIEIKTLLETLDRSPYLSTLVLTDNFLEDVEFVGRSYPSVRSIDMSNNLVYKWPTIFTLFKLFPNLEKIVMENNFISNLYSNTEFEFEYSIKLPGLVELDLSNNLINNLNTLVNLSHVFPNITRLKIKSNPFDFNNLHDLEVIAHISYLNNGKKFENEDYFCNGNTINGTMNSNRIVSDGDISMNHTSNNNDTNANGSNDTNCNKDSYLNNNSTSNKSTNNNNSNINFLKILNNVNSKNDQFKDNFNEILRMFIIVTFPNLSILNGTSITVQERVNSERYLNYLESKTNIKTGENPENQLNIGNNNRVRLLLVPDGDSESFLMDPIERRLPETCTVGDLKLLCSKLFKIDLKDIRLIYNSKMMPLSEELDDDSAELGRYGISDGYEIRAQKPSCKGRVIVNTSLGELDIHLWSSQCPKACRNFVQLCLEGYYNNCIFHRVIPNFMVQTGDPSGTGNGGESVYGEPFENEIVSRLKFRNRGMVGMANTGGKCSNMSQFFITLDRSDFLNGKYTLFGKVEGHSVYNLLKIGKVEVDKNDRPLEPPKIISCQVVDNPFEDIVPRLLELSEPEPEEEPETLITTKTRDKRLLSFIDSDEEIDTNLTIKSAHDLLQDKNLSKSTVQLKHDTKKNDDEKKKDNKEKDDSKKEDNDNIEKNNNDSDDYDQSDYSVEDRDGSENVDEEDKYRKRMITHLQDKLKGNDDELYKVKSKKKVKHDPKKTLERMTLFTKKLSQLSKNQELASKEPETDQDLSDGSWFAGTKLQFSVDSNRAYDYDAGRDTLDVYDPLKGKDNRLDSIKNIRNRNDGVEKKW